MLVLKLKISAQFKNPPMLHPYSEKSCFPALFTLVGMRTGPFTLRLFSLAPRIRSAHTKGASFIRNKNLQGKS